MSYPSVILPIVLSICIKQDCLAFNDCWSESKHLPMDEFMIVNKKAALHSAELPLSQILGFICRR